MIKLTSHGFLRIEREKTNFCERKIKNCIPKIQREEKIKSEKRK